ncbi:MAG TPA: LamG domain-containing protein [Pyrinomonadaceae bacterium]|jgi:murein DD-endopeptidase MepM/ murein hydrolase activator NlpD
MRIGNIILLLLLVAAVICGQTNARVRSGNSRRTFKQTLPSNVSHVYTPADRGASDNLSAAFGWQGVADTDLSFAEFFSRNHTVAARFMIQYARAYQAPILSVKGTGSYLVAVAGYGDGRIKAERLLVEINDRSYYYTAAGKLAPEKWHWLALVREGSKLRLYLDGAEIKPDNEGALITSSANAPAGTLRMGRRARGDAQFYGLIDDVAVFNSALSQKTLNSYYEESHRLYGTEAGLIAAYLFDRTRDDASVAQTTARRMVSFTSPATEVSVSSTRDSKQDALSLPLPFNRAKVLLPFAPGQAWKVIQGYGQPLSHNGGGCFSWDFARADGSSAELPVYAAAAGLVVAVSDNNDPEPADNISKDNFNYMQMEIATGEFVTYLHMKNGSLVESLKASAPASFPANFAPFPIAAGAQVGRVGNTWLKEQPENWHLHFAGVPFVNSPVSIPLAFSDYEVYDAQAKTWRRVERGVPQQNQIVRRANITP